MTGDPSKFTENAASMAFLNEHESRERAPSIFSHAATCASMSDADVAGRNSRCEKNIAATTLIGDIFGETDNSQGEVAASDSQSGSGRSFSIVGERLGVYDEDYDWESAQRH